ncbi:MAG: hypothetical protein WC829_03860 [Hyphomicrobium sp.]|jgi:hypothetical protein
MDLQTVKAQYGAHWAWARTAAFILFLVTGMLLAAALTAAHSTTTADALHQPASMSISQLFKFPSAG